MSTELYKEDLYALENLLDHLGEISAVDGVFSAEIRVKFDDINTWVVIGWGESGNPCVLRFEADPTVVVSSPVRPYTPFTINPGTDFNALRGGE